ncbi:MAG TPA: CRISPR-associated endonuclease Cas6 [Saprospiraceae bacterium]|nr:CRISPR-associated endonuclease Cas6 [Saprospiraceae bacterium]HMQ81515.1 CRISPR-associated endonuclease Cas6 [Saprospiraceae bacterium]
MQEIRIFSVLFKEPIARAEMEYFRAAIVAKVGDRQDRHLFHNHNNLPDGTDGGYHYRYPLVQYQMERGKPKLVFINEAINEAKFFFANESWDLQLGNRCYTSEIAELKTQQFHMDKTEHFQHYRLNNWLALNEANHQKYQRMESFQERLLLLENILVSHILAMAKGLGYYFTQRFEARITDVLQQRVQPFHETEMNSFTIEFKANVKLPNLSMGKGSSLGFGTIRQLKKQPDTATQPIEH